MQDKERMNEHKETANKMRYGLYLGGLPLACGENDVSQYFERFAKVSGCCIKRNQDGSPKGYGYVFFEVDAEVDIKLLCETQHFIFGKAIEVRRYVDCPVEQKKLLKEDTEKSIFVSKLPSGATDADMNRHFEKFGKIERGYIICREGKSRCFGFIKFYCPTSAEKALSTKKHVINGKEVMVSPKNTKQECLQYKDSSKVSCKSGGNSINSDGMSSKRDTRESFRSSANSSSQVSHPQVYPIQPSQNILYINGVAYAPICQGPPEIVTQPAPQGCMGFGGYSGYPLQPVGIFPFQTPKFYQNQPQPQDNYQPFESRERSSYVNTMPFIENYNVQRSQYKEVHQNQNTGASRCGSTREYSQYHQNASENTRMKGNHSKIEDNYEYSRDKTSKNCLFEKKKEEYCSNLTRGMIEKLYEESEVKVNNTSSSPEKQESEKKSCFFSFLGNPNKKSKLDADVGEEEKKVWSNYFNPCFKSKVLPTKPKISEEPQDQDQAVFRKEEDK